MARRPSLSTQRNRRRRQPSVLDRAIVATATIAAALLVMLSLAGAVANSIAGPKHPTLSTWIEWSLLCGFALGAGAIWRKWKRRQVSRRRSLAELLVLTPAEFERTIGDLLHDRGYRHITHVGQAGDLVADITAIDTDSRRVVVQCKRLAPGVKIGSPVLQTFIGMAFVHHRADRAIFVTTAAFTKPALDLAANHPVELWDGTRLSSLFGNVERLSTGR